MSKVFPCPRASPRLQSMRTLPVLSALSVLALATLVGCDEQPPAVCDVLIQHQSFFATAVDDLGDTAVGISVVYELEGAPPVEAVCAWRLATMDCVEWISGTEAAGHYLVTASGEGYQAAVLETDVVLDEDGQAQTVQLDFEMVSP